MNKIYTCQTFGRVLDALQNTLGLQSASYPVYKYINKEDLSFWLSEDSVRLSTIFEFRNVEGESGYGDKKEHTITNKSYYIDTSIDDPKFDLLRKNNARLKGVVIEGSSRGFVDNITTSKPNSYVFCAASAYSYEDLLRWNSEEVKYDAVIKINDIIKLMLLVQIEVKKQHSIELESGVIDFVKYEKLPLDLNQIDLSYYQFIKNETYKWQREIRISWPFCEIGKESTGINVKIPNLASFVDIVEIL